jgi:SAM-dependent methyltransferase
MTSVADPATLAFYAAEAPVYVTARPEDVSLEVVKFLKLLPPGASILELGCGGGFDAAYMIAAGFDVEPTDGVPEMAAEAEARLGRPVRVMRFDQLDDVERYDAVIASASLLHVPRTGLPDVLGRVWRALKPGGWHMATYKTGAPEGFDRHGRYYNQPTAADAEAFYRAAGDWSAIEIEESMGVGYFSEPSAWLKIVAQKAIVP